MNTWNGIGRLTKNVEFKYTPQGKAIANFTVAINRPFTNNQGDREADFILVQAWDKLAENLANFTRKGSLVGIVGRIQTRSYEGQDGKRVYVTEIVADSVKFLDPKSNSENGQNPQVNSPHYYGEGHSQNVANTQPNWGGQQQYGGQPQWNGQQQPLNNGEQAQWGNQQQQFNQNGQQTRRGHQKPFSNSGVNQNDLPF